MTKKSPLVFVWSCVKCYKKCALLGTSKKKYKILLMQIEKRKAAWPMQHIWIQCFQMFEFELILWSGIRVRFFFKDKKRSKWFLLSSRETHGTLKSSISQKKKKKKSSISFCFILFRYCHLLILCCLNSVYPRIHIHWFRPDILMFNKS